MASGGEEHLGVLVAGLVRKERWFSRFERHRFDQVQRRREKI